MIFEFSETKECNQNSLFETLEDDDNIEDGNIVVKIEKSKCEIYRVNTSNTEKKAITVCPSFRIRVETTIEEFKTKIEEIDETLLKTHKELDSAIYCLIHYFNVDEDYMIMDVYIKSTN